MGREGEREKSLVRKPWDCFQCRQYLAQAFSIFFFVFFALNMLSSWDRGEGETIKLPQCVCVCVHGCVDVWVGGCTHVCVRVCARMCVSYYVLSVEQTSKKTA